MVLTASTRRDARCRSSCRRADLLRTYGLGTVEEAAAHLRRHRDLF